MGLRYLRLGRPPQTLPGGEAQRVRLASLLSGDPRDLTVLLDEPSRGLHPREVAAVSSALRDIRNAGNTVVVVEHDPVIIAGADHEIAMGPGAGSEGGTVVYAGPLRPSLGLRADTGAPSRRRRSSRSRHCFDGATPVAAGA